MSETPPYHDRRVTDRGLVDVFDQSGDGRYFVRVVPIGEEGHTYAAGESDAPTSNDPDQLMEWGLAKLTE